MLNSYVTFDPFMPIDPNSLTAVVGQFQHARRVRFLGREASGYDRRSSPKKQAKIIPENWGPPN